MPITRRQAIRLLASAAPTMALRRSPAQSVPSGQFTDSRASLKGYAIPDWFADAKFGIWSAWGPQSAIGDGDWYARNMYVESEAQYRDHLERFGPQSKVGYKDLIHLFTADKWDPDFLIDLYQKAGAKYFFSMGVHHDGFDLWDSKYQPRWNSVASGPRKDIVGMWAAAARKRGLRFGVSEHLSNSFDWFAPAHLSDTKGPYAGIPYDGQNPAFADLYHDYSGQPANFAATAEAMGHVAPDWWKKQYFNRIKDLVDQHKPDLLYTDGRIPFGSVGLGTVAEIYNMAPHDMHGETEGVYFSKSPTDCEIGTCVLDRERGVINSISPHPWQSDTCIGQWHYNVGEKYKSAKKVIDLLVDIVSKNGNLLLSVPLPASGEHDREELKILEDITKWMAVNGEGIFATRPWKIYGEGPATKFVIPQNREEFDPNEGKSPELNARDIRFTAKGNTVYAFVQGWPAGEIKIEAFGLSSPQQPGRVIDVRILGRDVSLRFTQEAGRLLIKLPPEPPGSAEIGIAFRVMFA